MNSSRQGKVNVAKVAVGLANGLKKKDIAIQAGSLAKSDSAKCNAVARVMKSSEFKELACALIGKSFNAITDEKINETNALGLALIIQRMAKVSGLDSYKEEDSELNINLVQYSDGELYEIINS